MSRSAAKYAAQSDLLVARDETRRLRGGVVVAVTGPRFMPFRNNLELYVGIHSQANRNTRDDPVRTDPAVIVALGDLAVGVKGAFWLGAGFTLGVHLGLRILDPFGLAAPSGAPFDLDALGGRADAILTFDLRDLAPRVPLRVHLNGGYIHDTSVGLLPEGQCAASTANDACIRSRVVETFAFGLGHSRVRLAVAMEVPMHTYLWGGDRGLAAFAEYHYEHVVAAGDATIRGALGDDTYTSHLLGNPSAQSLTVGLRLRPISSLVLEGGVDVGLQSFGYVNGPVLPLWNAIAGLAFPIDIVPRR